MRDRLDEQFVERAGLARNHRSRNAGEDRPRVFILSDVRLYREGVAIGLARRQTIDVVGLGSSYRALAWVGDLLPDAVLLDASLLVVSALPLRMREIAPSLKIIAFAVPDGDSELAAGAEAGISAYVPREGSVEDIETAVHRAVRGDLVCSPGVAQLLLDHVEALSTQHGDEGSECLLTRREREMIPLIEEGLSNKEIARRLSVRTATVKNHIHNILEKLQVRGRGEVAARMRAEGAFMWRSSSRGPRPHAPDAPERRHFDYFE